ncbi:MAG: N-acetylmuramoyl-L-alanine amidase [Thermodesulfobacteriota bacterium]|nr:N-acetylmuramoyl-L-alanine amidase [Thermodesulfobacteriota bacterium]
MKASNAKRRYRVNWITCARKFEKVYKKCPRSSRADNAMYMVGNLYQDLYGYSNRNSDLNKAIRIYQRLIKTYQRSKIADDAQFRIAEIYDMHKNYKTKAYIEYSKVITKFPKGNLSKKAKIRLNRLEKYKPVVTSKKSSSKKRDNPVQVTRIRHWSNPDNSRVVIDLKKNVSYKSHLLKSDPSHKKPPRLYVDLLNTRLSPDLCQPIPINDGLLKRARAGQYRDDIVRVVLDIESIKSYKVFPLESPFRIVIDVTGSESLTKRTSISNKDKAPTLTQQLSLGIGKIVIDPGHGGRDPGAIGPTGLKEKDVVLNIAKKLESVIKERLGCEVVLTRRDDRFVPLEERTAIAITRKADLFISIHANASSHKNVSGIGTYSLNLSTDESAAEVAARENATTTLNISDLQDVLREILMNSKINESNRLAVYVQKSLIKGMRSKYSNIKDIGVKQAPFYVLIGADMPSILVEVSFISNNIEEKRLKKDDYLETIASSIFSGIRGYINGIKLAAY